jgi:hypothetical protein
VLFSHRRDGRERMVTSRTVLVSFCVYAMNGDAVVGGACWVLFSHGERTGDGGERMVTLVLFLVSFCVYARNGDAVVGGACRVLFSHRRDGRERMVTFVLFLVSFCVYAMNGDAVVRRGVSGAFLAQVSRSEERATATRKGLKRKSRRPGTKQWQGLYARLPVLRGFSRSVKQDSEAAARRS